MYRCDSGTLRECLCRLDRASQRRSIDLFDPFSHQTLCSDHSLFLSKFSQAVLLIVRITMTY